jgi:hypothetical protein
MFKRVATLVAMTALVSATGSAPAVEVGWRIRVDPHPARKLCSCAAAGKRPWIRLLSGQWRLVIPHCQSGRHHGDSSGGRWHGREHVRRHARLAKRRSRRTVRQAH